MATTPDITNANAATRTLNLQGGHTYAIYTYQRRRIFLRFHIR
mgnify:FL=1